MNESLAAGNSHVGDIFRTIARHMQEDFRKTLSYVEHPLEKGIAREKVLVEYLQRFVPERFAIDTGFVIDSKGNMSRQIDVIIYDRIISPVWELPGRLRYFPVECVVAVGEVKSTITDRTTLNDALEKLKSVQELDRYEEYSNLEVAVHGAHGHLKAKRLPTELMPIPLRILGFVFTSRSLSIDTMIDELKSYCSTHPKEHWPNLIVDFESYLISYVRATDQVENPHQLFLFPDEAVGFYATKLEERDNIVLLFASLLGDFLTVARVVRPQMLNYFGVRSSEVDIYPL